MKKQENRYLSKINRIKWQKRAPGAPSTTLPIKKHLSGHRTAPKKANNPKNLKSLKNTKNLKKGNLETTQTPLTQPNTTTAAITSPEATTKMRRSQVDLVTEIDLEMRDHRKKINNLSQEIKRLSETSRKNVANVSKIQIPKNSNLADLGPGVRNHGSTRATATAAMSPEGAGDGKYLQTSVFNTNAHIDDLHKVISLLQSENEELKARLDEKEEEYQEVNELCQKMRNQLIKMSDSGWVGNGISEKNFGGGERLGRQEAKLGGFEGFGSFLEPENSQNGYSTENQFLGKNHSFFGNGDTRAHRRDSNRHTEPQDHSQKPQNLSGSNKFGFTPIGGIQPPIHFPKHKNSSRLSYFVREGTSTTGHKRRPSRNSYPAQTASRPSFYTDFTFNNGTAFSREPGLNNFLSRKEMRLQGPNSSDSGARSVEKPYISNSKLGKVFKSLNHLKVEIQNLKVKKASGGRRRPSQMRVIDSLIAELQKSRKKNEEIFERIQVLNQQQRLSSDSENLDNSLNRMFYMNIRQNVDFIEKMKNDFLDVKERLREMEEYCWQVKKENQQLRMKLDHGRFSRDGD